MMDPIRPNILLYGGMAAFVACFVSWMIGGGEVVASVGLASVVAGGLLGIAFTLASPPPNPQVRADFAAHIVSLAAGAGGKAPDGTAAPANSDRFLFVLIAVAAGLSVLALIAPGVPQVVGVGLANATVGMITSIASARVNPPDDQTVPQSVVFEALKIVAEQNKAATK